MIFQQNILTRFWQYTCGVGFFGNEKEKIN